MTLPARRGRDAGSPIGLPPVGAALGRGGGPQTAPKRRVFTAGSLCECAAAGKIEQAAKGGGRCEIRGISCVQVVKTRHPGAECVLRLRDKLEKGKRLSVTHGETHSKEACAGRVRGNAS